MSEFSHFNSAGEAVMVDVSEKENTKRIAVAVGEIRMSTECFRKVTAGDMTKVEIEFRFPGENRIEAVCTTKTMGKTGVEMEALTGVSTALLTIYDMCKAVDRSMEIGQIRLLEKSGGKSGTFLREDR